jgi:plasmid stabilization system protein ParE
MTVSFDEVELRQFRAELAAAKSADEREAVIEQWRASLEILLDPELMARFRRGLVELARGEIVWLDEP